MTSAPAGITLATPGDWIVLDLQAFENQDALGAALDQRVSEEPALAPFRDELVEHIVRGVRNARNLGTDFAAVLVTTRDDQPMLASMTLTHVRGAGDAVAAATAHHEAVAASDDVSSAPAPLPVRLPAGVAGRTEHVREHELVGGTNLLVLSVQYLIPVPGTEDMAVLTFISPTLAARSDLVGRFHAIAETVEFEGVEALPPADG